MERRRKCLDRRMEPAKVEITVKATKWDSEEKEKWAELKRWIDSKGGVLASGQDGVHKITFRPPEDEGWKS